jgi:hypothetical protein
VKDNVILADEMGLGKTIQAIAYLGALWQVGGTADCSLRAVLLDAVVCAVPCYAVCRASRTVVVYLVCGIDTKGHPGQYVARRVLTLEGCQSSSPVLHTSRPLLACVFAPLRKRHPTLNTHSPHTPLFAHLWSCCRTVCLCPTCWWCRCLCCLIGSVSCPCGPPTSVSSASRAMLLPGSCCWTTAGTHLQPAARPRAHCR